MFSTAKLEVLITKDKDVDYTVLSFIGDLDSYNLDEKRKMIMETVEKADRKYLVFNFMNLVYINSESIGLIFQINEILSKIDKKLVIVNAKKNVVDVLKVIGLFDVVLNYKTMPEFINHI